LNIQRYLGITIMSASLVMLSLGSIPQSFAGTTVIEQQGLGASLTLGATCGLSTGAAINYNAFVVGTTRTATTTVTNGGTVDATLEANAGTNTGGGFADGATTHIEPISMRMSVSSTFSAFFFNNADDVSIPGGLPVVGSPHTLTLETTATIVNAPVVNPTLSATIDLTAEC